MAKGTSLFLPKVANNQSIKLTSSDTTTAAVCFTAGADDSDVKAIIVTSDDTAIINLKLYICRSSVDYLLGVISIPIVAGSTGALPSPDLLAAASMPGLPVDSMGKPYLPLKNGDTLKVGCLVTMTAAKTCVVSLFGQDY